MKQKPLKNYIGLGVLFLLVIVLLFYLKSWSDTYKKEKYSKSYLTDKVEEVKLSELEVSTKEMNDVLLLVTTTGSKKVYKQEEKIYEYRKKGAYFRIRDFSWWDLELPTNQEMENGIKNLEKINYKVDYIISHCCPTSIQAFINPSFKKDILTDYLQEISEKCEFKKWYFGHYHDYKQVNSQFTLLYENIVPLEFNSIFE